MTLPTPDTKVSFPPHHPSMSRNMHAQSRSTLNPTPSASPSRPSSEADSASIPSQHEPVFSFATRSWDLATGGLKTLTAKRELPFRSDRRKHEQQPIQDNSPNYLLVSVLLVCLILLLIGGGLVLFVLFST